MRKFLQLSLHLCIYGIVKVEYCRYNKGKYFVSVSHIISLSLKGTQRQVLCIAVHLISMTNNHICDTIPLHKLK